MKASVVVDEELYLEILGLLKQIDLTGQPTVVATLIEKIQALESMRLSNSLSPDERAQLEWLFLSDYPGVLIGSAGTGFFRREKLAETVERQKTKLLQKHLKVLLHRENGEEVVVEDRTPIDPAVVASLAARNILWRSPKSNLPSGFEQYFGVTSHHFNRAPWRAIEKSNVPRDGAWIVDSKDDPIGWIRISSDAKLLACAVNTLQNFAAKFGTFSAFDLEQKGISELFRMLQHWLRAFSSDGIPGTEIYGDPELMRVVRQAIQAIEEFEKVYVDWQGRRSARDRDRPMGRIRMPGIE